MAKPLSPKALKTLQDAASFVLDEKRKGTAPELIILSMIKLFGAKRWDAGYSGYKLRCGGVIASSTSNPRDALLGAWNRLATVRPASSPRMVYVPLLPIKLVDRPRRSEDPRLARANDDTGTGAAQ